jgi:phosphate/sulfate permease
MLALENFVAILGLIGFAALVEEYFGVIAAVIGAGLAIAGGVYAYNNFDPTGLSVLSGIVALICAAIWNKRRVERNVRKKAAEAIRKASTPMKDGRVTGQVVGQRRVNEGSSNAPANHAQQNKTPTMVDTGEASVFGWFHRSEATAKDAPVCLSRRNAQSP